MYDARVYKGSLRHVKDFMAFSKNKINRKEIGREAYKLKEIYTVPY